MPRSHTTALLRFMLNEALVAVPQLPRCASRSCRLTKCPLSDRLTDTCWPGQQRLSRAQDGCPRHDLLAGSLGQPSSPGGLTSG